MDFEDFVYDRTDGSQQSVFKALGDAGFYYVNNYDTRVKRSSILLTALKRTK